MTTQHYKRLEDGPMDEIDAAVWSGDLDQQLITIVKWHLAVKTQCHIRA